MTIAQPFKAGMRRGQVQVPEGRLNTTCNSETLKTKPGVPDDSSCTGNPAVERMFAGALLDLVRHRPEQYPVPLQCFRAGPVGFFAVPGEPFVETGLALKSIPGPGLAVPVGLANGYHGYIPLRGCFTRGGYEVKPGPALLCRGAADMLLAALREMASELF